MNSHNDDPKHDDPVDPWDRVTDEFRALGGRLRSTYRNVSDGRGPDEDEIKSAFTTLAGAWDQVAESVTDALRDPDTRSQVKKAAGSLVTALGETLSGLGAEFRHDSEEE